MCSCFAPEEVLSERGKEDYDLKIPLYVFQWAYIHKQSPFEFSGELPFREPQKSIFLECYNIINSSYDKISVNDNEIKIVFDDFVHSYSNSGWAFWIENTVKDDAFMKIGKYIDLLKEVHDESVQDIVRELLENYNIYQKENDNSISYVYVEQDPNMKRYKDEDDDDSSELL